MGLRTQAAARRALSFSASTRQRYSGESGGGESSGVQPVRFLQRIGIHHDPAPASLHLLQRLPDRRRRRPDGIGLVGFARDIEPGVALDRIHAGIAKAVEAAALVDLHHRHAVLEDTSAASHRCGSPWSRSSSRRSSAFRPARGSTTCSIARLAADRIRLADTNSRGWRHNRETSPRRSTIPDAIASLAHAMVDLIIHAGQPSRGSIAMLMAAAANPIGHRNIGQVSPIRSVSDFQRK